MDRRRFCPLSGFSCRSLQGVLGAMVWHAQGIARRLLGNTVPVDPKHLAELLSAGTARRLRRVSDLRPKAMRISLITPAPPGSRKGNRVTAMRWARLLRQL